MIKRIFKLLLVVVLIGTFGWTLLFLYKKSQKAPVEFKTEVPTVKTIIQKTVATGSVIPRREINMKSQVSGIIEALYVTAGKQIKAGDVIAKIKIIPNMLNLSNAENRLNQAKISVENAQQEYDRNNLLFKQNVIAKAELLPYEVKLKSSKEEVDASQNSLDLIKEGATKNSGQTTNTLIKSTISGMVLDVPVKEGSQVIESNTFNEGTTIAAVADMGEMIFEGKVDESEVGKLHQNMDLVLTVGAVDKESFKASLEYIAPKGITENGAIQFLIRAAVKLDKNTFLRAGYSANADIILAKKDSVLSIPESVLQFDKDKPFVEIEGKLGVYKRKDIKTGLSDGINIEVLEGIAKGDKIKIPQV